MKKDVSEALDELLYKKGYSNRQEFLVATYKLLGYKDCYDKANKEKGNFSKMLKGERAFSQDIILGVEKILKVPFLTLTSDDKLELDKEDKENLTIQKAVLDLTFDDLFNASDVNGNCIAENNDEYGKGLYDYIVEYNSIEAIRYLNKEHNFKYSARFQSLEMDDKTDIFPNKERIVKEIAKTIINNDDGLLFEKVFDSFELLDMYSGIKRTIYYDDDILKEIFNSDKVFNKCLNYKSKVLENTVIKPTYYFINPLVKLLYNYGKDKLDLYKDKMIKLLEFAGKYDEMAMNNMLRLPQMGIIEIKYSGESQLGGENITTVLNLEDEVSSDQDVNKLITSINEMIKKFNKLNLEKKEKIDKWDKEEEKYEVMFIEETIQDEGSFDGYKLTEEFYNNIGGKVNFIAKPVGKDGNRLLFEKGTKIKSYLFDSDKVDDITKLKAIGAAYKKLDTISKKVLNGKVYVNDKSGFDFIYYKDNEVKQIVGWERVTIGEELANVEDYVLTLINPGYSPEISEHTKEKVKAFLDGYNLDKENRSNLGNLLEKKLENDIKEMTKKDDYKFKEYHRLKSLQVIVDYYKEELNNL